VDKVRRHLTTIVIAFVTASVAAGGTAAVAAVVNANKLNGYRANQLIRVAAVNSKATGLLDGALQTASISAPGKGYLVITASSQIDDSLGINNGTIGCWLALDGTKLSASVRRFSLTPAGAVTYQSCATNVSWPVAKGKHTVSLVTDNPDGLATSYGPTTISVLYEPFNGTGGVPTPVKPS